MERNRERIENVKKRAPMFAALGFLQVVSTLPISVCAQSAATAYALLEDLRELPAALEAGCCGGISALGEKPRIPPNKVKRDAVYSALLSLDGEAVAALALGLSDRDVRIRRQAALALLVLGRGNHFVDGVQQAALDILDALA